MNVISQMRTYGEKIADQTIIEKVLRSLTPKFDHVVAAIEESKDLSIFTFDDPMGSLQAHEARISRSTDNGEEKVFQIKEVPGNVEEFSIARGRGRGHFGVTFVLEVVVVAMLFVVEEDLKIRCKMYNVITVGDLDICKQIVDMENNKPTLRRKLEKIGSRR